MIKSVRHKGLRRLYEQDDARGVPPKLLTKIRTVLALLDVAEAPEDLGLPGLRLHPLKGDLRGFWSVSVSGNWRIIFRFDGRDATDVELLDYH